MNRNKWSKWGAHACSLVFFILVIWLWQYLSDQKVWKPYLFPSPLEVWEYLCSSFLDGSLEEASWITVKRLVMGYGIGLVMGIPLGMLCSRFQLMQNTLGLVSLGFQALPSVCWVPLATLWFGQTEGAMLFVVADSLIGVNKFVQPFPHAVLVIVCCYFSGQALIAWGLLRLRAAAATAATSPAPVATAG